MISPIKSYTEKPNKSRKKYSRLHKTSAIPDVFLLLMLLYSLPVSKNYAVLWLLFEFRNYFNCVSNYLYVLVHANFTNRKQIINKFKLEFSMFIIDFSI